jgi:hypothetical protein
MEEMFTTLRQGTGEPLARALLTSPEMIGWAARRTRNGAFRCTSSDGVPLLVGHLLDDRVPRVAGVVDDDVEAAEAVHRGLREPLGEARRGDVAGNRHRSPAGRLDRGHRLLGRLLVEVVDHDGGSVRRELDRDLSPDAASGTGDDGDLAVQLAHV